MLPTLDAALERDWQNAPARACRGQVRRAVRGWLTAPSGARGQVLSAADLCGSPLLLVTDDLAAIDAEVSVTYGSASEGLRSSPTDYAVTVVGTLEPMTEVPALGRYIARFANRHRLEPGNMQDGDAALYHLAVSGATLHPTEGEAIVLSSADYQFVYGDAPDHTAREWDNLVHQNYQHLDINEQLVTQILGLPAGRWLLTGIDPEGMDFRLADTTCRLPFAAPALTQSELGVAIKAYLKTARQMLQA